MINDAPISSLRFALRAASAFIVEMLTVCREKRDFTDALIMAALVQSNSAPIASDPALRRRYGVFDAPTPESMRRPISVNAISASLGLPFETVRRRTKRLIADGVCEAVAEGVRFTDAALASDQHRETLEAAYDLVRSLYHRLKRAGCLELLESLEIEPAWADPQPPLRIVMRAATDYVLRMMEHLLPRFPNLSRAFIVLAVVRENTDALPDSVRGGEGLEPQAFVPDSLRKPARASDVAAFLGLPHETVRRNIAALVEDGRCQRMRDGVIVPASVLARQNVLIAWDANFRDLTRMFVELGQAGVLALWDAEAEAARTAA